MVPPTCVIVCFAFTTLRVLPSSWPARSTWPEATAFASACAFVMTLNTTDVNGNALAFHAFAFLVSV